MTGPARALAAVIALLLVVGLAIVGLRPLREMRDDIDAQHGLLSRQVEVTEQQLDLLQRQLEVAEGTKELVRQGDAQVVALLAFVRQLLEVARSTETQVGSTAETTRQLREMAADLLAVTRQVEEHAESIDRKTGPTAP